MSDRIPKERHVTHLLLALRQVEYDSFEIREATLSESQPNTVSVGGAPAAVQDESWHFGCVQKLRKDSGAVGNELQHAQLCCLQKVGSATEYMREVATRYVRTSVSEVSLYEGTGRWYMCRQPERGYDRRR
jgi:hypothetical protein